MKIGILLPHWEKGMAGATPRVVDILRHAQIAEDVGFDSVWLTDHFLYEPYADMADCGVEHPDLRQGAKTGFWECWTLTSAVAANTNRVEIGTLVANSGYRNPAMHARMADTVDEVSGGRLILGLGAGDFRSEHETFGYPWERRVGRFEEALQIICPLLRGESVTFKGEFYSTEDAALRPKGPRPKGPPILIGLLLGGPRMQRLVVQYADHWNCWLASRDSRLDSYHEPYRAMLMACEKHGRDPATLEKNVTIGVSNYGPVLNNPNSIPISGSSREVAAEIQRYKDFSIDHLSIWLEPTTPDGLEELGRILELLR